MAKNSNSYEEREKLEAAHAQRVAVIVAALGADWTATPSAGYNGSVGANRASDGLAIHFYLDSHSGRVEVKPSLPRDARNGFRSLRDWGVIPYNAPNSANPEMTYAIDREPSRVAAEIMRKVVEPYAPLYAAIREKLAAQQQTYREGEAAAQTIATLWNDPLRADRPQHESALFYYKGGGKRINPQVTVTMYGGGMRFQIDCNAATGIDLAKMLANFAAGKA